MNTPQELQQIAHIAQQAARLKDHYKFCINYLQYLAEPLWQEITKRTELNIDMCKHLMPDEMQIVLAEGTIDHEKILDRIKTCIMYTRNGTLTVLC